MGETPLLLAVKGGNAFECEFLEINEQPIKVNELFSFTIIQVTKKLSNY